MKIRDIQDVVLAQKQLLQELPGIQEALANVMAGNDLNAIQRQIDILNQVGNKIKEQEAIIHKYPFLDHLKGEAFQLLLELNKLRDEETNKNLHIILKKIESDFNEMNAELGAIDERMSELKSTECAPILLAKTL